MRKRKIHSKKNSCACIFDSQALEPLFISFNNLFSNLYLIFEILILFDFEILFDLLPNN